MTKETQGRSTGSYDNGKAPFDIWLPRLLGLPRASGRTSLALLPLRFFFGLTFIYAGLQKLTDPQFFSPTAPGFIGRQMSGFIRAGSPLSPLIVHLALEHAAQFGLLIAISEVWIGLSSLLGLVTRLGAIAGMALSLTFYLTATWTVHPYFLGADLPYAAGWLTLALVGPTAYSLDELLFGGVLRAHASLPKREKTKRSMPPSLGQDPVARVAFMRGAGTVLATAIGGGLVGSLAKLMTPSKVFTGTTTALANPTPASSSSGTPPIAAPAGYSYLGNVKALPANSAGQYKDPISGDPALLIHLTGGQFVAYDAICTHAGCTVDYDPTQRQIVCPCHGATFDPAHGAAVIAGPAPQPLAALQVKINARGQAFAKGNGNAAPPPAAGNQ